MADQCGVKYDRHLSKPHLVAVCARPRGHDGPHDNRLASAIDSDQGEVQR